MERGVKRHAAGARGAKLRIMLLLYHLLGQPLPRSALPLSLALGTLLLARRALQLLRRALQQTLLANQIWLVS